jgi:predicted metal-dependent peptidase
VTHATTLPKPDAAGKDERRLKKVMIGLMREPTFALFSGIMMCGETSVRDDLPTAATDGYNIYFGRQFIRLLDEKMVAFVIMHETMHKAFRHLSIYRKLFDINRELANCAADYVINLMLVNLDPTGKWMTFPVLDGKKVGLLDQRFAGMDTKQVWDILREEEKNKPKDPGRGGGGQGDGEQGEGKGEDGNSAPGGFDEHLWDEAKATSKEVQDTQAKELDRALRQGQAAAAKLAGKGSLGLHKELGELLDPQVPWEDLLREFVQANCRAKDVSSWRKINRRLISQELYMPSLIGECVREVVIGVDASGSTWVGKVLNRFLTETKAIIDAVSPEKLHLIYWDTSVTGVEEYDQNNLDDLVKSTQIKGGGGTDPSCVEQYLHQKKIRPECIIMLTDGYVPNWGHTWDGIPIMWVIAGNPNARSDTGISIHIKDD